MRIAFRSGAVLRQAHAPTYSYLVKQHSQRIVTSSSVTRIGGNRLLRLGPQFEGEYGAAGLAVDS